MAEQEPQAATLWYVRRGGAVKGPFPASQISSFVVLGRIRAGDEVSSDQEKWRKVGEIPGLIPKVVREGTDGEELQVIRQREDERTGIDRREEPAAVPADGDQRRPGNPDRRRDEPDAIIRHRRQKALLLDTLREGSEKERRSRRWIMPVTIALTLAVIITGVVIGPTSLDDAPDCAAAPGPAVNWNNCTMDLLKAREADLAGARVRNAKLRDADLLGANLAGADLAYTDLAKANLSYVDLKGADLKGATLQGADLTYADLTGADLSYANLKDARLGGAIITGTLFSEAVWHDGRICARESVGQCAGAAR